MSGPYPIAIEACERWPEGKHPIAAIEGNVCVMIARPSLTRQAYPIAGVFPDNFDPIGEVDCGPRSVVHGVTCETMDGALFVRAWLDTIRAMYFGVAWRVGVPACGRGAAYDGADARAAYGCLGGRVVGMVAEVLP